MAEHAQQLSELSLRFPNADPEEIDEMLWSSGFEDVEEFLTEEYSIAVKDPTKNEKNAVQLLEAAPITPSAASTSPASSTSVVTSPPPPSAAATPTSEVTHPPSAAVTPPSETFPDPLSPASLPTAPASPLAPPAARALDVKKVDAPPPVADPVEVGNEVSSTNDLAPPVEDNVLNLLYSGDPSSCFVTTEEHPVEVGSKVSSTNDLAPPVEDNVLNLLYSGDASSCFSTTEEQNIRLSRCEQRNKQHLRRIAMLRSSLLCSTKERNKPSSSPSTHKAAAAAARTASKRLKGKGKTKLTKTKSMKTKTMMKTTKTTSATTESETKTLLQHLVKKIQTHGGSLKGSELGKVQLETGLKFLPSSKLFLARHSDVIVRKNIGSSGQFVLSLADGMMATKTKMTTKMTTKMKKKTSTPKVYSFLCNAKTVAGCLDNMLMGAPMSFLKKMSSDIDPSTTPILLFNMSSNKFYVGFTSVGVPALNLKPRVWPGGPKGTSKFPAQLLVECRSSNGLQEIVLNKTEMKNFYKRVGPIVFEKLPKRVQIVLLRQQEEKTEETEAVEEEEKRQGTTEAATTTRTTTTTTLCVVCELEYPRTAVKCPACDHPQFVPTSPSSSTTTKQSTSPGMAWTLLDAKVRGYMRMKNIEMCTGQALGAILKESDWINTGEEKMTKALVKLGYIVKSTAKWGELISLPPNLRLKARKKKVEQALTATSTAASTAASKKNTTMKTLVSINDGLVLNYVHTLLAKSGGIAGLHFLASQLNPTTRKGSGAVKQFKLLKKEHKSFKLFAKKHFVFWTKKNVPKMSSDKHANTYVTSPSLWIRTRIIDCYVRLSSSNDKHDKQVLGGTGEEEGESKTTTRTTTRTMTRTTTRTTKRTTTRVVKIRKMRSPTMSPTHALVMTTIAPITTMTARNFPTKKLNKLPAWRNKACT